MARVVVRIKAVGSIRRLRAGRRINRVARVRAPAGGVNRPVEVKAAAEGSLLHTRVTAAGGRNKFPRGRGATCLRVGRSLCFREVGDVEMSLDTARLGACATHLFNRGQQLVAVDGVV